jgi:ABC-2 type transport system ATP-binding protein
MIEVHQLAKHYGGTVAVDGLSFTVHPGRVTGFLGPNGAGKSTTMRVILGLDAPTAGHATIGGQPYARLRGPLHRVGALLDAGAVHGGRTARNHLLAIAASNGIGRSRVAEVLGTVGLDSAADKRVRGFSLGMKQRLGIAAALLGDPGVLLFDEPVNGLDPEGVHWVRGLFKQLAGEGRTVFVSSHLMSEMALTAGHLIVIGRGRLIADTPIGDFVSQGSGGDVLVRSPAAPTLAVLLHRRGATVTTDTGGALAVTGLDAEAIGDLAAAHHLPVHELTPRRASLEEAFMELTREHVDYHAGAPADTGKAA